MVQLYFKHLYPSMQEWQEKPFAPWAFQEQVLMSVLSFFESSFLDEEVSLKEELQCQIFMDSGAFAAATMGFEMDPYEVAEVQMILKADLLVPLDLIIFEHDSQEDVERKIASTIKNTEILIDHKPKGSQIIAPLQGFSQEILTKMFDRYKSLGLKKFALGGVLFQENYKDILTRIAVTREITKGFSLHVFGRFLHPQLLKDIIQLHIDSVDGYGYIVASVKGQYIKDNNYVGIQTIEEIDLDNCNCSVCKIHLLEDFQRGNKEAQLLLVQHNIEALIKIARNFKLN